mgnify:CR=1 FL=1
MEIQQKKQFNQNFFNFMDKNKKTINQLEEYKLYSFFYFAPIKNIESIVKFGILSKNDICEKKIKNCSFANEEVQNRRSKKFIMLNNKQEINIHNTVPIYLKTKTPTFYSPSINQKDMVFIVIDAQKLLIDSNIAYAFCDGNAASINTNFYNNLDDLNKLPWDVLENIDRYWNYPDGKRKGNAEFLIYPSISLPSIENFVVFDEDAEKKLKNFLNTFPNNISITIDKDFSFFNEILPFNSSDFLDNK